MSIFTQQTAGKTISPIRKSFNKLSPHERFGVIDEYYENNSLYMKEDAFAFQLDVWKENIRGLRTCVNRAVEFHAAKVCSGKPGIVAGSASIERAVRDVLKWSAFEQNKRKWIRQDAKYGNLFLKLIKTDRRIYIEDIEPSVVTDFEEDGRGNLLWIRIDVPITEDGQDMYYTEYWTVDGAYTSVWKHTGNSTTSLQDLGTPTFSTFFSVWGIDFIPIVHVKFIEDSDKWGRGVADHAILKIDDANRQATRVAELMFRYNKGMIGMTSVAMAGDSRPTPPPVIENPTKPKNNVTSTDTTDLDVITLPSNVEIKDLSVKLDYVSAINLLKETMSELEQDLPEIRYYALKDSQLSGKAIGFLLAGAIDRAEEAQSAFVAAMIKLLSMALTVGKFTKLFDISGSYENGAFDVSLSFASIQPTSTDTEKAATLKTLTDSNVPLNVAMKIAGYEAGIITEATTTT